jgi:hypothetical protein
VISLVTIAEFQCLTSFSSCQAWNNSADYYRSILAVYHSYVERKNKQSLPALITGTEQSALVASAPHLIPSHPTAAAAAAAAAKFTILSQPYMYM